MNILTLVRNVDINKEQDCFHFSGLLFLQVKSRHSWINTPFIYPLKTTENQKNIENIVLKLFDIVCENNLSARGIINAHAFKVHKNVSLLKKFN